MEHTTATEPYHKPVLVLFVGAGFSAHAGAPVMSAFLDRAIGELPEEVVTRVRAGYYLTGYAMRAEANLEMAYGAMVFLEVLRGPQYRVATLQRESGRDRFICSQRGPTVGEVLDAFKQGIAAMYGHVVLRDRGQWISAYSGFLRYLLERFQVGVVTTNYDLVIETALNDIGQASWYPLGELRCDSWFERGVPIFKLHGSVNWDPSALRGDPQTICTYAPPLERAYVLPPTWNKDMRQNDAFASVWRNAAEFIGLGEAILVVGQSFPPSDAHLDYLFANGLAKRSGCPEWKRVSVIDMNLSTAQFVCDRFRRYQTVVSATPHGVCFQRLLDELKSGRISL